MDKYLHHWQNRQLLSLFFVLQFQDHANIGQLDGVRHNKKLVFTPNDDNEI